MQISRINQAAVLLELSQISRSEDLFAISQDDKENVERLCSAAERSFRLLSETPIRDLAKKLSSSGISPTKQVESASRMLQRVSLAIDAYTSHRVSILVDALFQALVFSYLRSLDLDFSRVMKEGSYAQPLPYERLERYPEWPDYASYFYCKKLSSHAIQRFFFLSQKIQEHLNEGERVHLVQLEFFLFLGHKPAQRADALPTSHQRLGSELPIDITSPLEGPSLGESIEYALQSNTTRLLAESSLINAQIDRDLEKKFDGYSSCNPFKLKTETAFDAGSHLVACLGATGSGKPILQASYVIPRIDALILSKAAKVESKLRGLQAVLKRRYQTGNEQDLHRGLVDLARGDHSLLVKMADGLGLEAGHPQEGHVRELNFLLDQIKRSGPTLLYGPRLKDFIGRVSKTIRQGLASSQAHEEFYKPLFSVTLAEWILNEMFSKSLNQLPNRQATERCVERSFQLLIEASSGLFALLPPSLDAQRFSAQPSLQEETQKVRTTKRRGGKRKKKPHKTRAPKGPTLQPKPSPPLQVEEKKEEETAPALPVSPQLLPEKASCPVSKEIRTLSSLVQMPLRIRRHPRTYNRPEFSTDRKNQALHYLPPKLVQLLLRKNPFIAKYVQWKEKDPEFSNNHSAHATMLCHDREANRVYVGELTVGVTSDDKSIIYHIYLNPYASPLEGRQTLKRSIVHCPPTDLEDAEKGLIPSGKCQISYNEELGAIDALDIENHRLYRVFELGKK